MINENLLASLRESVRCAEMSEKRRAHTLAVEKMAVRIGEIYAPDKINVLRAAALLHDICKTNFYKVSFRNAKNAEGKWESVPFYTIEDNLPYGHGEKSVYIASGFMRLTRDEAFAIRYHMGFSGNDDPGNVGRAMEMFPLAFFLHCADSEAAYFMEETIKN